MATSIAVPFPSFSYRLEAPLAWFAVRVKARHEKSVTKFLEGQGYQWFLPIQAKNHLYGRRTRIFELPLFPGYVFCRFQCEARLPVLKVPGVLNVLGLAGKPLPIEDDEIEGLQKAVHARLPLSPCPYLQTGEKVRITEGPLRGAIGSVIRLKDALRVVLSVTLLQRSVFVEVESTSLSYS